MEDKKPKSRVSRRVLWTVGIAVLLIIIAAVVAVVVLRQSSSGVPEVDQVLDKVGKHYVVPSDETPALITVVDGNKLTSAYLKKFAKTGDKVLLYKKQRRVVIYRPSVDKIVDIGVLQLDSVDSSQP